MRTLTEQERYVHGIVAQILAERVAQKLIERQKQALVVYTGSNMGIEPGLECLRMLRREEGFSYRVLLTRSAAKLLDVSAIRSALEPEELWIETPGDSPEALTVRYDTILVPAMTVNTAAHVAACMADTPAAAVILDGLMRGKNVIVAVDGCCPDNPERVRRGFHMTEALKNKLRGNKNALRDYGAFLTTSDGLGETAKKAVLSFASAFGKQEPGIQAVSGAETAMQPTDRAKAAGQTAGRSEAAVQPANRSEPVIQAVNRPEGVIQPAGRPKPGAAVYQAKLEGRVFGGKHIKSYPDHAVILVPKGTLITQLVSDEARRRDIRIEIES